MPPQRVPRGFRRLNHVVAGFDQEASRGFALEAVVFADEDKGSPCRLAGGICVSGRVAMRIISSPSIAPRAYRAPSHSPAAGKSPLASTFQVSLHELYELPRRCLKAGAPWRNELALLTHTVLLCGRAVAEEHRGCKPRGRNWATLSDRESGRWSLADALGGGQGLHALARRLRARLPQKCRRFGRNDDARDLSGCGQESIRARRLMGCGRRLIASPPFGVG